MDKNNKARLVTLGDMELLFANFFGQLVTYFDLDRRFAEKADKDQVERLITSIDGLVKRVDDDDQDRALNDATLNRHGRWINELATKTSTQLSPP
jgi:hypothetical protein